MSRVGTDPLTRQGHGTLLLTLNGDHYMYGQQAGSIHPTGILSFYDVVMLSIGGGSRDACPFSVKFL